MDGILFDTERVYVKAERESARQMGFEMPEPLPLKLFGSTMEAFNQKLAQEMGPGFDVDEFNAIRIPMIARLIEEEGGPQLLPGVAEALPALKKAGYRLAVASSTQRPTILAYLESAGIVDYFDVAVSGEDVERGKPAPDVFLTAAKAIGFTAENCAAVEDSFNGIRSAHAAGCYTIMIPNLLPINDEMHALAHAVLEDMGQLPTYLQAHGGLPV